VKRILCNPKASLVLSAVFFALFLTGGWARAAGAKEIAAAKAYLTNTNRAKSCLFFAYPTATYQSATATVTGVKRDGRAVPGEFAVTMRYTWKNLFNDTNTSDLIFFFDPNGRLTELQAGSTTSIFNQFSTADLVINAVKDELMKEVAKWKDATARQTAATLINKADARGLLTLILQQDQP
jgi:hypothetical protein